MDMTEVLTGTQQKSTKKVEKKSEKKSEKKETEAKSTLKPKTDKSNKVTKKAVKEVVASKAKEIKLPKADLLELENFAKEFSAFK